MKNRQNETLTVGMKVLRSPEISIDGDGRRQARPMRGTVCFVHPKGRFHKRLFLAVLCVLALTFPALPAEFNGHHCSDDDLAYVQDAAARVAAAGVGPDVTASEFRVLTDSDGDLHLSARGV